MSLSIVSGSQSQGPISRLPEEVLAAKVFPFLMDVEDPQSFGAIHRVCKQWHAIMNDNFLYTTRMEEPDFLDDLVPLRTREALQASSLKEFYLSYCRKSLKERMELAYTRARQNTTSFEAEILSRLILSSPMVVNKFAAEGIGKYICAPLVVLMANFPESIRFSGVPGNGIGWRLLVSGCLLPPVFLTTQIFWNSLSWNQKLDECFNFRILEDDQAYQCLQSFSNWMLAYSFLSLTTYPNGTGLGEFYREAKGSIAAMVPVGKKVIYCVKSALEPLSKYVPSVFRKREVEASFPRQLFTTQSSPSLPEDDEIGSN